MRIEIDRENLCFGHIYFFEPVEAEPAEKNLRSAFAEVSDEEFKKMQEIEKAFWELQEKLEALYEEYFSSLPAEEIKKLKEKENNKEKEILKKVPENIALGA